MKKIIFVDDEPNILQALRRMLRSMRQDFALFFAGSGKEALDIMATESIDVVVSDMRMPGMDGAELLTEIRNRHPHTIRIMLTGQADEESTIRTVGVVHQFLAKPCDPDNLKNILRRMSTLQDMLSDSTVKNTISRIGTLPSLPQIYQELQQALIDPEVSIKQIGQIIAQDVAISAKILQLVNSSFFGLFSNVNSPERAVNLLGVESIKTLVLGIAIFAEKSLPDGALRVDEIYRHSLTTAQMAKAIGVSESDDPAIGNDCFLAGMLHDIGKLVLLDGMVERYRAVITAALEEMIPLAAAEHRGIGVDHGVIGAYLTGLWGFENGIVEGLAYHHQPLQIPYEGLSIPLIVHAADVFYYELYPDAVVGAPPQLAAERDLPYLHGERVEKWRQLCITEITEK